VRSYAPFSSIGPTADKRIKPDIAAQGDNVWVVSNKGIMYQGDGTSYAAPLAAGAIACIMQAHPKQTPTQIVNAIKLASSRYYKPDVYSGYGLPDLFLTHQLLQNDSSGQLINVRKLNDNKVHVCITSPVELKGLFVVQDESGKLVLEDEVQLKAGWNRIPLKRSHHLPKGIYNLQFRSSIFSTRSTFNHH
jgi:serine protease AprX